MVMHHSSHRILTFQDPGCFVLPESSWTWSGSHILSQKLCLCLFQKLWWNPGIPDFWSGLGSHGQAGLGLGRTFCLKNSVCFCICFKNSGGVLTFQIFGLVWAPMVGRFELWWLSRGFTSTPPSAATGVGFIAISFRSQVSFGRYYETNCNYPGRYPDHPILFLPD